MDISKPFSGFFKSKQGGFWASVGLLFIALVFASIFAVLGLWVVRQFIPQAAAYYSILFGVLALIIILQYIAKRYQWIMPWYYLLPAILFLFSFTFIPVMLTITLAFTDYAGIRNGQLNISSSTNIVSSNNKQLILDNPKILSCDLLMGNRKGCNNVRAVVYAAGRFETKGLSLKENKLTLESAPPTDRQITAVEITMPSMGFSAQFPISGIEGNVITLERTPPEADLENIILSLDRLPIERKIIKLENDTVFLDEALPDGLEYVAIARYNDFGWVGFDNFKLIASEARVALFPVFLWNLIFAISTILINTVIGVFIALLLNNPHLRFRNLYRTLLIVPWALPAIITIQVWRGFLNQNFGAINRLLALLDLPTFDWLGDQSYWALAPKAAILLVNLWLGLPFMMTAVLGALSAIPRELYEATKMDGANAWQAFWGVTSPLLRTALIPITLTGFAFNFNNFNLIFLLTDGGPPCSGCMATARSTDILISWAYNESFRSQGGYAYGLGSAISIIIFMITLAISLMNFKVTGALKEEVNT